jgi:SAM-dependent methyltransferase
VLYGVVDFHKCCEEARGLHLPLSGIPIYYRRCASCGFLFTDAFDAWSEDEFKAHIYNEAYQAMDPDYRDGRPRSNAEGVVRLWGEHRSGMRVLDFGGGNDVFCAVLRDAGFPTAVTYDPMVPEYARRPEEKFDLVTCFEALEHMPDPNAGIASILECVAEPGLIFYSTYAQPTDFDKYGLAWWYIGPRNGHVSIFSREALSIAWGRHGYKNVSLSDNAHLAFRTLPPFLSHLQAAADRLPTRGVPIQEARLAAAPVN